MRVVFLLVLFTVFITYPVIAEECFEKDVITTSAGDLEVTMIGHGSLMMTFGGKVVHIDPFSRLTDYAELQQADLIIITHHHSDHLDLKAMQKVRTKETMVVLTNQCAETVSGGIIMKNGDVRTVKGIEVKAVPAYNLVHKRDDGRLFHPKGEGNGYVMTFGDKRVYVAGDTENTSEMKALERIDYAFLPMNLPYTMTPEMVVDAVNAFKPKVVYPYHYGETDTSKLVELLKDNPDIEVRIRKMK
jgi:L-ascorbate metabolism protein UlaG (beta-lactamase superfamily)